MQPEETIISEMIEKARAAIKPPVSTDIWRVILARFKKVRVRLSGGAKRGGELYKIMGNSGRVTWDAPNTPVYMEIPREVPLSFIEPENADDFRGSLIQAMLTENNFLWEK